MMIDIEQYIRESNEIEGIQADEAVESSTNAWNYIKEQDQLNHKAIQKTHEYILQDRQPRIAGDYRDIQVDIAGAEARPPPPVIVKPEIDKLLDQNPDGPLEALEWHIAFEQIHPFEDGNGRTGRLIYLWHCLEKIEVEPIIWRAEDREGYYDLFRSKVDLNKINNEGDIE